MHKTLALSTLHLFSKQYYPIILKSSKVHYFLETKSIRTCSHMYNFYDKIAPRNNILKINKHLSTCIQIGLQN